MNNNQSETKLLLADKENNYFLLQSGSKLLIYSLYSQAFLERVDVSEAECDGDCEVIVEMLGDNKIKVTKFSELYQFNCCRSLLDHIKMTAYGLKLNGYSFNIDFDSPVTFEPKGLTNVNYSAEEVYGCPGAKISLKLNGQLVEGEGTFVKYMFFENIENVVSSIDDLMSLYVGLSIAIAKACDQGKDDMFLCCDDWLTQVDSAITAHHSHLIKPEIRERTL